MSSPAKPRAAYIFDMDGTLVDNMDAHAEAWIGLLGELGVEVSRETFFARAAGKTNRQILELFLGAGPGATELARLAAEKEARYREIYAPQLKPLPGLRDFLAGARRDGIPLAVATSAGRANIGFVLGGLGLEPSFDAIVSEEDGTRGKPDPEMFLLAARRLGASPEVCTVFEDSRAGIEAGARAGMAVVALATSLPAEELARHPGVIRVIRDFVGLRDISS
jgi:beta-phosphoglucomutase family hydrolase